MQAAYPLRGDRLVQTKEIVNVVRCIQHRFGRCPFQPFLDDCSIAANRRGLFGHVDVNVHTGIYDVSEYKYRRLTFVDLLHLIAGVVKKAGKVRHAQSEIKERLQPLPRFHTAKVFYDRSQRRWSPVNLFFKCEVENHQSGAALSPELLPTEHSLHIYFERFKTGRPFLLSDTS